MWAWVSARVGDKRGDEGWEGEEHKQGKARWKEGGERLQAGIGAGGW